LWRPTVQSERLLGGTDKSWQVGLVIDWNAALS
jgi:hypothetical protein